MRVKYLVLALLLQSGCGEENTNPADSSRIYDIQDAAVEGVEDKLRFAAYLKYSSRTTAVSFGLEGNGLSLLKDLQMYPVDPTNSEVKLVHRSGPSTYVEINGQNTFSENSFSIPGRFEIWGYGLPFTGPSSGEITGRGEIRGKGGVFDPI